MLRAMYRNLRARLSRAGVEREHAILDYGCGSGQFLGFLRDSGYASLAGFDEYSSRYADRAVLTRTYDCVVTQDVIEHVDEPLEMVSTLHELTRPGGVVVIGTPNAEAIDLACPEARVHTLHQPYHRHLLSKTALQALGKDLGWELLRYYPTMYANTSLPFVNTAFINHYFKCFDDCVDIAVEGLRVDSLKLWTPLTLAHGLFGSLWAPECDVMAIFRRA
jgi:2-polyprenyl-3-methyl-5-hydroxy-6-metoxy-1,4-benzoquinol methylase